MPNLNQMNRFSSADPDKAASKPPQTPTSEQSFSSGSLRHSSNSYNTTAKLEPNTPSPPRSTSGSIFGRERLRRSVLESDVREKEKELTKLQGWCEGLERALAKERSESHRLATDLQDTQTSLSQEKEDCRRLNSELHEARGRIDTLDALLEEDGGNATNGTNNENGSVSDTASRDKGLQDRVQHTVVTKNKALEKNATLKDQLERMDDRVLSCQAERDQARSESEGLRIEVSTLKSEKKVLTKRVDKLLADAQKSKEENQKHAQDLSAKDQLLQQLRNRVADEESKSMALSRRVASLEIIANELSNPENNKWVGLTKWVNHMCSSSLGLRLFGWLRRPWWSVYKGHQQ